MQVNHVFAKQSMWSLKKRVPVEKSTSIFCSTLFLNKHYKSWITRTNKYIDYATWYYVLNIMSKLVISSSYLAFKSEHLILSI